MIHPTDAELIAKLREVGSALTGVNFNAEMVRRVNAAADRIAALSRPLGDAELREIESLLSAATVGPWHSGYICIEEKTGKMQVQIWSEFEGTLGVTIGEQAKDNAALMGRAPSIITKLLRHIHAFRPRALGVEDKVQIDVMAETICSHRYEQWTVDRAREIATEGFAKIHALGAQHRTDAIDADGRQFCVFCGTADADELASPCSALALREAGAEQKPLGTITIPKPMPDQVEYLESLLPREAPVAGTQPRNVEEEALQWLALAYRDTDFSTIEYKPKYTCWNMAVAYAAGKAKGLSEPVPAREAPGDVLADALEEIAAWTENPDAPFRNIADAREVARRALSQSPRERAEGNAEALETLRRETALLLQNAEGCARARTDLNGSPEYALTWKTRDMPSGPPICALRASARPISGSGSIGWPTPSASGFEAKDPARLMERRAECKARTGNGNGFGLTLGQQVCLMQGWPTPAARDHFPAHRPDYIEQKMAEGHGMSNLNDVVQTRLLGWATPTAITDTGGAALCKWGGTGSRAKLREAVGDTVLNGALAPEFALWLMGFPIAWARSAERVTQSSRKSRRNSLAPISTLNGKV